MWTFWTQVKTSTSYIYSIEAKILAPFLNLCKYPRIHQFLRLNRGCYLILNSECCISSVLIGSLNSGDIRSYSKSRYIETHYANCFGAEKRSKWPNFQDLMKFNKAIIPFALVRWKLFTWLFDKSYGSISVSGQLPTHPSPNSTTVNWQQVKVNVGLGEG